MLELSIPQLGEESRNVKDLVFTMLASEQPLSLVELTNRIRRQHAVNVTYQAVRKAVNTLHRQGVLLKTGKKYAISKEWIFKLKTFFDKLLTTYEAGTKVKLFTAELAKEDYAVYTFNNLLDLDNFWGDIMAYWADHAKDNKNYLSYCHYHWWLLINLGHETTLFRHYAKRHINSAFLIPHDVPLNQWAAQVYTEMGVKTRVKPTKEEEPVDINILGDMIIQVKYGKKIMVKIKSFFEKYKNLQEVSIKEITRLAHEPCEIKFLVFKNATIANNLREKYLAMLR